MDKKQTKMSIVDAIYKNNKYLLKDVHAITSLVFEEMAAILERGEKIEIRGFGTFSVQFREGRTGVRNPKTGEVFDCEPHSVVVFRPGKVLSAAVRPIGVKEPDEDRHHER